MIKAIVTAGLCYLSLTLGAQNWQMADVPLATPWASKVNPENVLPEYPRPMMVRPEWKNLNGLWQFQEAKLSDKVPFNTQLQEKILVPFPWESALSGIRRQLDTYRAWYRRTFTLPENWDNQRVLLHFGAVDWEAVVYVNGRCAGTHQGAYDAFSFDITPYLEKQVAQEIIVAVYDPGNSEGITVGKQNNSRFADPQRYAYAPSSGIWQTVWLEAVPQVYLTDIKMVPDVDNEAIVFTINASTQKLAKRKVEILVKEGSKQVAMTTGGFNTPIHLHLPNPKLWSPNDPFLYDVEIRMKDSLLVEDVVTSYVGMRKIAINPYQGIQRILLNDTFVFQMGPLDQGYWPDGLYTAPTDEALKWDIEQAKAFGFNMIRKHIKVEPQRWYYWCDKMGILVWQDMPSTFSKRTEAEKTIFETELQQLLKTHWNHPSIINWVVFNEHWGAYDVERLTEMVMALDPSRLVTGNSGIDAGKPDVDYVVGHIKDNHSYRPPSTPFGNTKRAIVNGEYGAIGYLLEDHVWDTDGPWVHFNYEGKEAATLEYERFINMILKFQEEGLSAAVYTQWTDVENEMNGIFTYDRKQEKLDQARITAANRLTWALDRLREKYR
ncbi:MAG: glycoside hydrolase family 2 TIM barrel-domain containing protein [Saprospiraceae bacterium]